MAIRKKDKYYNIIDFIILTLFILFMASAASFLESDVFMVAAFLFSLSVFIYRKRKFDSFLLIVLGIWCAINIVSIFVNKHSQFSVITFLGFTLRILMPYFMVKSIGYSFFDKFFKYAYQLVLISFLFFLLESFFTSFISDATPYLNFMTQWQQLSTGGFYLFIYMHSGWAEKIGLFVRNCGFMWEPGGYACVLTFLLSYRLYTNSFRLDKEVVILMIAIITTFSTAGYLSLFIIFILYLINNKTLNKRYISLLPIFLGIVIFEGYQFYSKSTFLKGKIDSYLESKADTYSEEATSLIRVSRLGIAIVSLDNAIHRPWGEGIIKSEYIIGKYGEVQGPSSLAEILRIWGWLGIVVLCLCMYNFSTRGKKMGPILLLPMLIVLFSNPFMFKYLVYAIVYFYFSYSIKFYRIHKYE